MLIARWLQDYKSLRDFAGHAETTICERLAYGQGVHTYALLASRWSNPFKWSGGHLRAALLAAAYDRICLFVEIPFSANVVIEVAEHMARLREDFLFEVFAPFSFVFTFLPEVASVRIALYSTDELQRGLQLYKDRGRAA